MSQERTQRAHVPPLQRDNEGLAVPLNIQGRIRRGRNLFAIQEASARTTPRLRALIGWQRMAASLAVEIGSPTFLSTGILLRSSR
ncbi:hypothetical protein SKAU_G00317480 [Synaphobranchus kaupii]|uniref:Uncharacterized protein n=1 Tax=Synaphobranchus kaupii TaxID=118154 RepID=A0A9Q1ESZ5_SYNKA|nr:hypothetical protein SKAU_G00317480 [Synaphobranchus kaupii]